MFKYDFRQISPWGKIEGNCSQTFPSFQGLSKIPCRDSLMLGPGVEMKNIETGLKASSGM